MTIIKNLIRNLYRGALLVGVFILSFLVNARNETVHSKLTSHIGLAIASAETPASGGSGVTASTGGGCSCGTGSTGGSSSGCGTGGGPGGAGAGGE
jgi:hypothetical protein